MKFKSGDNVVHTVNPDGIARMVIGYTSNGLLVTERLDTHTTYEWKEEQFKLAPKKHKGWINIRRYGEGNHELSTGYVHDTKAEAISANGGNPARIATIEIEWEE